MTDADALCAAERLRQLVTDRFGFAASAMPDDRIRAALVRLTKLDDLVALPLEHPSWRTVVDAVVIGETHFYRQAAWFEQLVSHVLQPLVKRRAHAGWKRLRLWSAGCATGEEAYTLAIVVDRLLPCRDEWDVRIIGSDLSATFIEHARRAVYGEWSLRELDPKTREAAFEEPEPRRFALVPRLRDLVEFRTLNLAAPLLPHDDDLHDLDLIVCRNVLMYLAPDRQRAIAHRLAERLASEGCLAVAPAEADAALFRPLIPVNLPSAIFFRVGSPTPRSEPGMTALGSGQVPAPHALSSRPHRKKPTSTTPIPKTPDQASMMERIRKIADHGDLESARAQCEALLVEDILNHDAHVLLGLICQEQRDLKAALSASRRAIYIDSGSAAAHFLCATSLKGLARSGEAQREMRIVLRLLDAGASAAPCSWDLSLEQLRTAATEFVMFSDAGRDT
jgi:chemotaxis protein methyltransferase CheR